MTSNPRQRYHHGDLAAALLRAALEAIEQNGAHATSLRSVARSVGVDSAAVYRHYRNKAALLEAAARDAYGMLGAEMKREIDDASTPRSQFMGVGRAYVTFALQHPRLFELLFGPTTEPPPRSESLGNPFQILEAALEQLDRQHGLCLPLDDAAIFAWSAVHGLAALAVDGRLTHEEALQRLDAVLAGVTRGVLRSGDLTGPGDASTSASA
jgi:AcrR family transcriptional regulator